MADEAKRQRTNAKSQFTRSANSLKKALESECPKRTIEKRLETTKERLNDVHKAHFLYIETLSDNVPEADGDIWIDELSDIFDSLEVEADTYIEEIDKIERKERVLEAEAKRKMKVNEDKLIIRDLEKLKVSEAIKSLNDILQNAEDDDYTKHDLLKTGLSSLNKRMEDCEKAHRDYLETLATKADKLNEGEWIIKVIQEQNETIRNVNEFISKTYRNTSEAKNVGQNIKVERVKFEIFDGNLRSYGRFKAEFTKHIRPVFKSEEEAFVLRSYLSKSIREEVDNLGDDINAIWERLDEKYGNKRKLIDCILSDIKKMNNHKNQTPEKTLGMINVIEKAHRELKDLGMEIEMNNSTIVSFIEERLPPDIDAEWVKIASAKGSDCKLFPLLLELLLDFKRRIEYKMSDLRRVTQTGGITNHAELKREDPIPPSYNQRKQRCWLHPDSIDHPIWKCESLEKMNPMGRYEAVRDNRACFKCLSKGHFLSQCRRNFTCKEEECGHTHHTLLHGAFLAGAAFHGNGLLPNTSNDVILQIQRIGVYNNINERKCVNALWDGGSTLSFITFRKAKELKLTQQQKLRLQIEKVGGDIEEYESCRYNLSVVNENGENIVLSLLGINKISSNIVAINSDALCAKFTGMNRNLLNRPTDGEIDCLIGYDYAAFHPVKEQSDGHLLLLKNQFGYVIGGSHPNIAEINNKLVHQATMNKLIGSVGEFYSFESLGVQCKPRCGSCRCGKCHPGGKEMSLQEEKEYELIEKNISYDGEKKKWIASYPWIKDPSKLPDNRQCAQRALKSCEKRLHYNTALARSYCEQIEDMKKRNVCRLVNCKELEEFKGPKFYISHHAVHKPDSKSTPLRIVFNSSANYMGHSLNDYYAKGPDMLNNLFGVLLRFREEFEAFHGDISKMFHSIAIPIEDQMTHLFLWRNFEEERTPDT